MQSLRAVKGDIEDIKLMLPPEPEPPLCQCCRERLGVERGGEGECVIWCDECYDELCPPWAAEFLAALPRTANGTIMACGSGQSCEGVLEVLKRYGLRVHREDDVNGSTL